MASPTFHSPAPRTPQPPSDPDALLHSLSVHNLPLLYADVGLIRIFVPPNGSEDVTTTTISLDKQTEISETAKAASDSSEPPLSTDVPTPVLTEPIQESLNPEARAAMSPLPIPAESVPFSFNNAQQMDTQSLHSSKKVDETSIANGKIPSSLLGKSPKKEGESPRKDSSTLQHNMVVIQVNSCSLQPHADNPLPR